METLLPTELVIDILHYLPLPDLLSAYHVNQRWRDAVPNAASPQRLRLLRLCFHELNSGSYPIALASRLAYVDSVERKAGCSIPDDYRTLLTEWPSRRPPPGTHWPHAVRFFAHGFCSCNRAITEHGACFCAEQDTKECALFIKVNLRDEIFALAPNGGDLDTAQNAQTLRFILAHRHWPGWPAGANNEVWTRLPLRCLRLSPYFIVPAGKPHRARTGEFFMVLEGPCRGQIHGWLSAGWYDRHEADDFWSWTYEEMDDNGFLTRNSTRPSQLPGQVDGAA